MSLASQSICGVFGKLPNYGDFLSRDLPSQFTDIWDAWLQNYVSSSQEQLGEHWLDIYLTSPIWRFTFSPGVIDNKIWLGLMIPSVDRVGRYFPFSVVCSLQSDFPATSVHEQAHDWFEAVETILNDALEGQLQHDELIDQTNALPLMINTTYQTQDSPHSAMGTVTRAASPTCNANALYPLLLDTTLKQLHTSYSLWSTAGSQYVEPCMFTCKAMPAASGIAAMLDGDWEQSRWCEPFLPVVQDIQTTQASAQKTQVSQAPAEPSPTPIKQTPREHVLDGLSPVELEPEAPLSQEMVYIPEDFLEDDAFDDLADNHAKSLLTKSPLNKNPSTKNPLQFQQPSSAPTTLTSTSTTSTTSITSTTPPTSPDITQPRPAMSQPQAVADEMDTALIDDPFNALSDTALEATNRPETSGQPLETTDSVFSSDQPAVSNLEIAPVLDDSGFTDPFAGGASIALDEGSFEISGVDASDIVVSDADPFGLALDPNNPDNNKKA